MDAEFVTLHIVPDECKLTELTTFDPRTDGSNISSMQQIMVNKCTAGYSIIFHEHTFIDLAPSQLISNLIGMFLTNLPNSKITFTVKYHWMVKSDSEIPTNMFSFSTAQSVLECHILLSRLPDGDNNIGEGKTFNYSVSDNMRELIRSMESYINHYQEDEEEDEEDQDVYSSDDFLKMLGIGEDGELPKMKKFKIKKAKKKKYYGQSRVMRKAHNPKRSFKRHGVLISSKSDMKKDEKIIKEFLKDFIPGNQGWKKEFRSQVLKRWMQMYAISKKNLKKMEKKHKKHINKEKKVERTDRILDIADKVFTTPIDRWYDPTK